MVTILVIAGSPEVCYRPIAIELCPARSRGDISDPSPRASASTANPSPDNAFLMTDPLPCAQHRPRHLPVAKTVIPTFFTERLAQ